MRTLNSRHHDTLMLEVQYAKTNQHNKEFQCDSSLVTTVATRNDITIQWSASDGEVEDRWIRRFATWIIPVYTSLNREDVKPRASLDYEATYTSRVPSSYCGLQTTSLTSASVSPARVAGLQQQLSTLIDRCGTRAAWSFCHTCCSAVMHVLRYLVRPNKQR